MSSTSRLSFRPGSTACAGDLSVLTRDTRARWGVADAHRSVGRGDPLGRLLVQLLPEPESIGLLARCAAGIARARVRPQRAIWCTRRAGRSLWNPRTHRRGLALVERALFRACGHLCAAGGDRGGPFRDAHRRRDRLGPDRRPLRRAAAARPVAGGGAEPRRCGGDARRARSRAGSGRRDPRPGRACRLPPRACRARLSVPATGPNRGRASGLPTGA